MLILVKRFLAHIKSTTLFIDPTVLVNLQNHLDSEVHVVHEKYVVGDLQKQLRDTLVINS